jgi:hypothetical protein
MKKGFLNSSSSTKPKKTAKAKAASSVSVKTSSKEGNSQTATSSNNTSTSNLIYELDSDGNMMPIPKESSSTAAAATTTTTLPTNATNTTNNNNPLLLHEVQSTMATHLQNTTSEWATPSLLAHISENHPNLERGMNNPKFMAVLHGMQSNPKETLERLQRENDGDDGDGSNDGVLEFVKEFCGVLGEHFVRLGEEEEEKAQQQKQNLQWSEPKVRELGPLEEKALHAHQIEQEKQRKEQSATITKSASTPSNTTQTTNAMDDQVASILANDDLRSILLDPKMQQIMQECTSQDGKLHYYMRHEEYGPKLRKLMEAGLLKFAEEE